MTKQNQILWTACVTPFTADGQLIDYKSLEVVLRLQEQAGNGIVVLGSTGEGLSLDERERREVVEFACGLNLKTELMVGVPSHNFVAAKEWLAFCKDLPIHGYLMTTPIYTKPGVMGQTKWFEALLDAAGHPAMLYNIPGRAGVKLHADAVKNLQSHANLWAIKDSSGTVESVVDYKIAAPNVAVFCGDDYMMPAMAAEGAVGLVSVASNAWPEATRRYVEFCLEGRQLLNAPRRSQNSISARRPAVEQLERTLPYVSCADPHSRQRDHRILTSIWWQAVRALFTASNPIPVKALLADVGIISSDAVRLPLSILDLPSRKTALEFHKTMLNWSDTRQN